MSRHKSSAVQYTIRNVPAEIDRALRQEAKRRRKSLNEVALEGLARMAGRKAEDRRYQDLDELAGTWVEDPEFDEAQAAQSAVDPRIWK